MSTHHFTPGSFLASIPATLGFFPQDSLLLAGFRISSSSKTDGAVTISSGPIARINLADRERIDSVSATLTALDCDFFLGFIIKHGSSRMIAQQVKEHCRCTELPVGALWSTYEIAAGEQVRLEWVSETVSGIAAWKRHFCEDTIPPLERTTSMRDLIARGEELPELDRDSFIGQFRRDSETVPEEQSRLWSWALENKVMDLYDSPDKDTAPYRLVQEFFSALDRLPQDTGVEQMKENLGFMELIGSCLADRRLRDMAIVTVGNTTSPVLYYALQAAAQVFSGTIRANALTLLALESAARQWMTVVPAVLSLAQEEEQDHTLAELLFNAYMHGLIGDSVAACTEAAEQLCSSVGIQRARCS
ncbi:hypothetical protein CCICO_06800 [Corynebacterium ciconiae DSM 44920]|uniref:DUF4192 domain-containing protein n=1 Tax=Corynebacterium ciconiae TaxID=227319 RepID=UPI000380AD09|nr:DUF4192 domain-containing protein [Corynebacterium ciconiae]WKD61380.1 hypothetical protein CCICO_06800 [Corynebacterium ciconiae DSM 44920]